MGQRLQALIIYFKHIVFVHFHSMALVNPFSFEDIIPDDVLYLMVKCISINELQTLMNVNRRWMEVSIRQLSIRTGFVETDLINDRVWKDRMDDEDRSRYMDYIIRMLKLMPAIKSIKLNYTIQLKEKFNQIIETIANYNPLLDEISLVLIMDEQVHDECLEKIIEKLGSKLKVLNLRCSWFDNELGRSLFEGLPNLVELKMEECIIAPEMFEFIPGTLKKLSLLFSGYSIDEGSTDVIEALARSDHSSLLEDFMIDDITHQGFELICRHFPSIKILYLVYPSINDARSLRELRNLKKFIVQASS